MGIKGLSKYLKQHAAHVMNDWRGVDEFRGKPIAIDASPGLYTSLTTASSRPGDENDNSHVYGFLTRTIKMLELGLVPIWVFDGESPEMKTGTLSQREGVRNQARERLQEAREKGDSQAIQKYAVRLVKANQKHNDDVIELLNLMGVPAVQAPSEAEALCVALALAGRVEAVATEDMDALAFGAPLLLRFINQAASSPKTSFLQRIQREEVLKGLRFSEEQFLDFCILCGCDYLPTIQYVGPATAQRLMHQHKSIEEILQHIDRKVNAVPEQWDYEKVRHWFRKPDVGDVQSYNLERTAPNLHSLRDLLLEKHFLQEAMVEKYLARLDAVWRGEPPPQFASDGKSTPAKTAAKKSSTCAPMERGQRTLFQAFKPSSKAKACSTTVDSTEPPAKRPRVGEEPLRTESAAGA
mmetsp:Transcript_52648/g.125778  ORF Transcript_52648/g.125778 Transcript_52648/m.125778 type:complete len:410 (+) Transcript_52648:50-1279(+)